MKQRLYFRGWHSFGWWLLGIIILSATLFYLILDVAYAGRIFPGVYIGDINLSGQSLATAEQTVTDLVKTLPRQKITFQTGGFNKAYTLKDLGIVYSATTIAETVTQFGRQSGQPLANWWDRLRAVTTGAHLTVRYQEQLNRVDQVIGELRTQVDQAGVDGEVIIVNQTAKIKPAVTGRILDGTELKRVLEKRWERLLWSPLELPIQLAPPVFYDELTQLTADKINQNLTKGYVLTARDRQWNISLDQLWQWVEIVKQKDALIVRLRSTDLANYLQELKTLVDQPVQDAVWVMQNDRVVKFQPDRPGVTLDTKATADEIQAVLLTDQREIVLKADYKEPKTRLAEKNNLGVAELVARGESNFAGSPKNRRHNIAVGAARFDRVLVAPGETFSFNTILGTVDETTGYLPELVIKGDETTPEFGGGLCQVSTTAFRAALNGGYPIKARQNHSYRVSYYEPAGTDATVYQPYPDLRFLNDTSYHILVHTYVNENNLYFDFYSTKTGQRVELEGPRIYNVTEPPPPVYIETSTLPEREEKKVDTAHRGAETILYRHIYDAKGKEIRKDTFKSFYIPWPAKYLIGVKEAPQVETNLGNVPPEATASETPPPVLSPTL